MTDTKVDRWLQCRSCGEQVHIRVWTTESGTILVEVVNDELEEK
jgi:hypothetical protein